MQFYNYTTSRPKDPISLKLLVYFVMLIVTVNLGSETYSGYAALVAGWGNVALVDKPPQEIILSPLFKAIVALCVQNFYAWRIWAFLQRTIAASLFCALMVSLSLLQLAGGIGVVVTFYSVDSEANFARHSLILTDIWLVAGLMNDILITVATTIILLDARSNLLASNTKTRLGKLIRLTVQTGAFTSLLAMATLILSQYVLKTGLFQIFPAYLLDPSYALSLLYNLNINVGQTRDSFQSSFYVSPSSSGATRFKHSSKSFISRPLQPERTNDETFEFSLRSTFDGPSFSGASLSKPAIIDHDVSNINIESADTSIHNEFK